MALVEVRGLATHFTVRGATLRAVDGVDLDLERKETLALVGESGSGKSTLGKTILRLLEPAAGTVRFDGVDISHLGTSALRPIRRRMQMVFQDPYGSLNPRMTVGAAIAEALVFSRAVPQDDVARRTAELIELVGLPAKAKDRLPHELSGGQRQRVGIARALSVEPELVVLDEPVSALDVSVRAQILTLLESLRERLGLTMLFISHDLSVVEHFASRVAVMYLGRIVEVLDTSRLADAKHPYTRALLDAAPVLDPNKQKARAVLEGDAPSPTNVPNGCPFAARCALAEASCEETRPELVSVGDRHDVACPVVS